MKIVDTLNKLDIVSSIRQNLKTYMNKLIQESQTKYTSGSISSSSLEAE